MTFKPPTKAHHLTTSPPPPPQPQPQHPEGAIPTQILPYLFVGPQTTTEPSVAAAAGITHIISLGCRPKHNNNNNQKSTIKSPRITYHYIGLQDTADADLGTAALLVADIISNARRHRRQGEGDDREAEEEAKVLVHCMAGVSRSPAVLAYYLMRDEGMSLRDALGAIVRARPVMRPNDGFLGQLKELERGLRGEGTTTLEGVDSLPFDVGERIDLLLGGVEVDGVRLPHQTLH